MASRLDDNREVFADRAIAYAAILAVALTIGLPQLLALFQ